jgi:hypothetical protein
MSTSRLNSPDRLGGDACAIDIAYTEENYELLFDIWSTSNNCAAADIVIGVGRKVWGVVYEIPGWLICRETSKPRKRKSLDAIEGEGANYHRTSIKLRHPNGTLVAEAVETYIGRDRRQGIKTSLAYVSHILEGLKEHKMPSEYCQYVRAQILANNPQLATSL